MITVTRLVMACALLGKDNVLGQEYKMHVPNVAWRYPLHPIAGVQSYHIPRSLHWRPAP